MFAQRIKAMINGFRNPTQPVKFFGGLSMGDSVYGGASGLTSRNRDLTFTEEGAATAFGIIVEVQRGVMFIADSIAMLPGGIYDSRTDELLVSLDTRQLDINKPGATFIRAMRQYERQWLHNLLDSIVFSDWLYGETFVLRLANQAGGVSGMRWLNPLYTNPMTNRGRIDHYDYGGDDGYFRLLPDSMAYRIHHRNPYDDLRGISPVLSALPSMNIGRNAERGVMSYFRNGMVLGGVMMPQSEGTMLSGTQISRMQQDMKQNHEGVDNAFRWLMAPTLMSFQMFDQPDMQKNYTIVKDSSKKIMMALGVPPELAGNPDSVSYDNADKIMQNWLKVNGKAYANKIASYINTSLLPYFEPNASVYFKFDFTQVDRQDAALVQSDFNAGFIPMNVARAQRGYEVDNDLDNIYIIGGKPVHKDVLIQVSRDAAAFGFVTPTPLSLNMPGQITAPAMPALPASPDVPLLPEPQKGAASLCVMLSLANNPDLIDLQKRLKVMYPDPSIKWNDPSDFHITMLYAPAIDDMQIDELVGVLPETSVDGLSLKVGQLNCFDNVGEHALHFRIARNSALMDAQASLYDTCEAMGLQVSGYSRPGQYTPHITMGYLPEKIARITFHGKVSITPMGVICSVERGGEDEIVYPVEDSVIENVKLDQAQDDTKNVTLNVHTHDVPMGSRDYSPEKALIELKAWQTFTARGKSSRPFVFDMLKGDPADIIAERLAAGDSPSDIVKALKPRFDGSLMRSLQTAFNEAVKATLANDEDALIKSVSGIRSEFEDRLTPVIDSMRDGSLDNRRRAGNIIRQLIRQFGSRAYRQGLEDAGVDEPPDDDEQKEIDRLLADSSEYVSNFTNELINGAGLSDGQANGRAAMWFNGSVTPLYSAGLLAGNKNQMMEFVLGPTEEHCQDCPRLNKQRHRFKDVVKRNLDVPKVGQATECEGWQCECKWIPVTGKARGSW
jgi:phage portal protein BeeE/2'-5' RNA ligase